MAAPVILIAGTWGHESGWWRPTGALAAYLRAEGLTILGTDDDDPYTWTTDLDGLSGADTDWDESGKALLWYAHLKAPNVPVSVVAHSHGGQVLAKAARHGLMLDHAVTVATPPRASLTPDYVALRSHSAVWTHIWTDEPYWDGWQRRGQFEWSWTGLKRALWPVGEMATAHVNIFEAESTHAGLVDIGLWQRRGWARYLKNS